MRSLQWNRNDLIAEVQSDLWRYLTPAASVERDLLQAEALLQMESHELQTLGRLQFLISVELGILLEQLPFLVRQLATTTASEEEWSAERIRGSIQWGRTIGVRYATGIPNLYVTSPARRAYQTPENELLVAVLDAVVAVGRRTGWHRSASEVAGKTISSRVAETERWLQTRQLLGVQRRPITPLKLSRIRAGRHRRRYWAALAAYERYRLLAERLDRRSIRTAVETYGLVSRDDATLFELLCTFRVIQSLRDGGWGLSRLGLFAGSLRLTGQRNGVRLELVYQATPRGLSRESTYRAVQQAHSIPPGALRPDLVLRVHTDEATRWLLVEVKGGHRPVVDSARAAAYDLLAYRTAFATELDRQAGVYGIGIAWGHQLAPVVERGITLCTPDTLGAALEVALRDPTLA